jgi:hypothetical protein
VALALTLPAASQAVGTGRLTVNMEPQVARAAGAQWRVGAGAWQPSGAWVYGLREGDHLVTFKATPGFVTPASRLVGINGYYPTFLDAGYCGGGSAVAWGSDHYGQRTVPDPDSDFVAVAAGGGHSLGLKADGRVVCWGWNAYGQCRVPAPNSDFAAISAGVYHSLGLKKDGSVDCWGWNPYGQCTVPAPNSDFVAVSAGEQHSVGLKADGRVVCWGSNRSGQRYVPDNGDFVAVAAGTFHSLGLKADGRVVCWGSNYYGKGTVPGPNSGFVAIAAGENHSLGLKAGGRVVCWGDDRLGQCTVPAPNCGFIAIAAGGDHSLGLKADGSVVGWGENSDGQCTVPAPDRGFVSISAGYMHSLALRSVAAPDTTAPTVRALGNVTVRRGGKARLRYRIDDPDSALADVTIRITRDNRRIKTIRVGDRSTNRDLTWSFRCNLRRGTYSWRLYATDAGGNQQAKVKATVRVKRLRVR